jgi:hypothetical protein
MEHKKLKLILARHEQFIRRCTRMIAADGRGDALPPDAQFHTEEIQSLDSASSDILIELTGGLPRESEWIPPGRFAFINGYGKPNLGWLRSLQQGLQKSKNYLELFDESNSQPSMQHYGDNITNVNAAGVVLGAHAHAGDISSRGAVTLNLSESGQVARLAAELSELRKALRQSSDPDDPQHDIEMGAVAQAEQAASKGDQEGALNHLKGVGKWCLEVATKIGVSLAAEAIKHSIGLSK